MRTTIRIDEQLLKEAKQLALRSGKSLTSVIEDALRESLSRQRGSGQRKPAHLATFSGQGFAPRRGSGRLRSPLGRDGILR